MSTSSSPVAAPSSTRGYVRTWLASPPLRVVALVATFTFAAVYESVHLLVFSDGDIWWRLRTGSWIFQNHAVPRTGLFSQAASRSWIDASWGFDLLVGIAYRLFGLAGLPLLLMLLQVAIAAAFFLLARTACRRFWPALALAAVAQFSLAPFQPRPARAPSFFLQPNWHCCCAHAVRVDAHFTGCLCCSCYGSMWIGSSRMDCLCWGFSVSQHASSSFALAPTLPGSKPRVMCRSALWRWLRSHLYWRPCSRRTLGACPR